MQSKRASLIETCINVGTGFIVSLIIQLLVFPLYGIQITLASNLEINLIFTIAAIAREYGIRRFFNWINLRGLKRVPS